MSDSDADSDADSEGESSAAAESTRLEAEPAAGVNTSDSNASASEGESSSAAASRAEVAALRAQLEAEREKKRRYKEKVVSQNQALETVIEDADAAIEEVQEKLEARIEKLNTEVKYAAIGTVAGVVGNAVMLNPVGAVQELVGGMSRGYQQRSEAREWEEVNSKLDLLWGPGRHADAVSVSDSNVEGLNVDLMDMQEKRILKLLNTGKFPPDEVDDMLEMPPGTTARFVRNKAIEKRLDERAAELAEVKAHNETAGARALEAIEATLERRRKEAEEVAAASNAAREAFDADLGAVLMASDALDGKERDARETHAEELRRLRESHEAKLETVARGFRDADLDVEENVAPVRAKLEDEAARLEGELPARLAPLEEERAALQSRRDAVEGRGARV